MFGRREYSRAMSADLGELNRRLRSLEAQLERIGGRASAGAMRSADQIGDAVASALHGMADRLRDRAGSAGDQAVKLGNDALHRVVDETKRRPLVMIAVAAGVGALLGLAAHRR
jgi:ElaB/YqjD/DUF883 family membrane-anchored ribosome-binding protein